ncbi:MAG TPA: hypothetical protein VF771_17765 [Longimicrobiaceae bacterium]
MKRTAIALAALAGLFLTTTAAAPRQQDEWVAQVRRQLQQYGRAVESRGYSLSHQILTGSLDNGESEMVEVRLDIGTLYQIMGACDNDCTDLDLTLYNSAGNEVDSDLQVDDYPVVSVEPGRTATYRIKVTMARCSAEPCRYGIGIFGK